MRTKLPFEFVFLCGDRWIHKGYFVGKKIMLNVCIKAFWYTKDCLCSIFLGQSAPLEVKVAEDHGKQKAAFYAGFSVSQQEVTVWKLSGKINRYVQRRGGGKWDIFNRDA